MGNHCICLTIVAANSLQLTSFTEESPTEFNRTFELICMIVLLIQYESPSYYVKHFEWIGFLIEVQTSVYKKGMSSKLSKCWI